MISDQEAIGLASTVGRLMWEIRQLEAMVNELQLQLASQNGEKKPSAAPSDTGDRQR